MPVVKRDHDSWLKLDKLVATNDLVVDRPRGSPHPRHPSLGYPLDYGYLHSTCSGDGDGVDVWIGRLPHRAITAIICTTDLQKRDAEIKILLGCTPGESREALNTHNTDSQAAILVERDKLYQ